MIERREDRRKKLILQCRYYNGETEMPRAKNEAPADYGLFWDYEQRWVEWSLEGDSMIRMFEEGIREFHLESKDGDKTPLTLKALLLNRYMHWSGDYLSTEELLANFEAWYARDYLMWETNAERSQKHEMTDRNKMNGMIELNDKQKQTLDEYMALKDAMLYFSTGGNTGCAPTRFTPERIDSLCENEVFVFGSNKHGHHHAGAAAAAMAKFGAKWGVGDGLCGQSYAISSMEGLMEMAKNVNRFILFAMEHQELRFLVTPIGCGIAGYTPLQIAPMFDKAAVLPNVFLPKIFWEYIWEVNGIHPDFHELDKKWKDWDR